MSNFSILYRYELKKLLQKKILWISLGICALAAAFSLLFPMIGHYYVDGMLIDTNYNYHKTDQSYRRDLSGRIIDQMLLEDTLEAYRHVPMDVDPYSLTEEYQTFARPYSEIFNLIRTWTQLDTVSAVHWAPDESAFYEAMKHRIDDSLRYNNLTDRETLYWQQQMNDLQTPFVYQYHDGYMNILEVYLTVGVMMILFIAITLSTAFPDEHTRRTDQLILCTEKGRNHIYWVKLSAGLTVGVIGALLMTALTWILSLSIYGAEGFDTIIQLFYTSYAGNLTIGQACLIAYSCLLVTALLISVLTMFLSELLHSGIASLAIITGLLLASSLIQLPPEYRVLGQLWDYFPTSFLAMWNTFDCRLIDVFGTLFTSYQIVPLVYLAVALLLAVLGKQIYARYQVTGR